MLKINSENNKIDVIGHLNRLKQKRVHKNE